MLATNGDSLSHYDDHIYIPVFQSDEVVAVPVAELPEDPEDVLDMLRAEEAPLALWVDFAKAYLAGNRTKQFLHLLNEGTSDEVKDFFADKDAEYERIQIHCALAAYYTTLSRTEKDRNTRSEYWSKAQGHLSSARGIDYKEQLPQIGLGQLFLAKGDLDSALKEFDKAMEMRNKGRSNIAGLLATAALQYHRGRYHEALQLYQRALRMHPGCPPEVRLGIGACRFKLGDSACAKAAFERVLQLDPDCCCALLGLAVLCFNGPSAASAQAHREGLQLLCRAFEADPTNPAVLNLLAQYCLLQGEYGKAKRLALTAVEAGGGPDPSRAESLALVARAHHASGELNEAYRLYVQANKLAPKLPLPLLGLAQMAVLQGPSHALNAIAQLEAALTQAPGWPDALRLLGALWPKAAADKCAAAVQHCREAAQKPGSSPEVWELLADLLASTDPAGSLQAYKKALELHRTTSHASASSSTRFAAAANGALENGDVTGQPQTPPAKLLNNAAVMHFRGGETAAALSLVDEALATEDDGSTAPASKVTMGYNHARLLEALGDLTGAAREYRAILEQFPLYADCHLRLAMIARRRGDTRGALVQVNAVLKAEPKHPDALAVMASLHMSWERYGEAKKVLEVLLGLPSGKTDTFAKLCLANHYFYVAPDLNRKPVDPAAAKEQAERASHRHQQALSMYQRVLEKDPSNIYAANGIGAVLAEQGDFDSAREIFTEVQEAAAAAEGFLRLPNAAVNQASLHLGAGHFTPAIQLYETALRKFYHNRNAQVVLYLARAYYDSGDLAKARKAICAAVHLTPWDNKLRFDAGLCMQQAAVRTLNKERPPGDPTKLTDFDAAQSALCVAARFFGQLAELGSKRCGIETRKLVTHRDYCNQQQIKVHAYLERAQEEQNLLEAKRQQQLYRMEAAQRRKEEEELKRLAAEEFARRERERHAREAKERLESLKAAWRNEAALKEAAEEGDAGKVGRKRGRKGAAAAAEDAATDDLFADEEGDEEYDPARQDQDDAAQAVMAAAGLASSGSEEEPEFRSDGETSPDEADPSDTEARPGTAEESAAQAAKAARRLRRKREEKEKRGRKRREKAKAKRDKGPPEASAKSKGKPAAAAAADATVGDLFGEEEASDPRAAATPGAGPRPKGGRLKRRRDADEGRVAELEVDDDDEEAPAKRVARRAMLDDSDAEEDALMDRPEDDLVPPVTSQPASIDELFGSDEE